MNQLDQLCGQPCINFRLIAGGSLILYLGDRPDEHSLTAWRLHLDSAWRLDGPSVPLVGSLDACCEGRPPDWVFQGLKTLIGEHIEKVTVGSTVRDLRIEFTGGYRLHTFAHCVSDGEIWEFRNRDGLRMAVRSLTELVEYREALDYADDHGNAPKDADIIAP